MNKEKLIRYQTSIALNTYNDNMGTSINAVISRYTNETQYTNENNCILTVIYKEKTSIKTFGNKPP